MTENVKIKKSTLNSMYSMNHILSLIAFIELVLFILRHLPKCIYNIVLILAWPQKQIG